jgi:nucleoid DNA-binding protein
MTLANPKWVTLWEKGKFDRRTRKESEQRNFRLTQAQAEIKQKQKALYLCGDFPQKGNL